MLKKNTAAIASDITDPNWRARPVLPLKTAARLTGVSVSSLYRYQAAGKIEFCRLGDSRTLVRTSSLIEFIDSAEDWSPSDRADAARNARAERAREAWR